MSGVFKELLNLLYPQLCPICGDNLLDGEEQLCSKCIYDLPRTRFPSFRRNAVCERLAGKLSFEQATAGFHYQKESAVQILLESIKYRSNQQLALFLGHYAGMLLERSGFLEQIDLIIPVPLHKNKQKWRGYNQSELIARGLADYRRLPVDISSLSRRLDNPTQTRLSIWERSQNARGLFCVHKNENIHKKHILLVDDVLTSGSTIEACGNALLEAADVKLSVFALALA